MFSSSIILLIWCCHSSPCTNRPQPTTGRNSWLCFKVPDFTAVGNGISCAEFTDEWPSETFLLLLHHKLQPPGPPLCQRQPNQTKEVSDLLSYQETSLTSTSICRHPAISGDPVRTQTFHQSPPEVSHGQFKWAKRLLVHKQPSYRYLLCWKNKCLFTGVFAPGAVAAGAVMCRLGSTPCWSHPTAQPRAH